MLGTYYSGNQIYPLFDDTIHFEMQICLKVATETASLQLEYVERRVVLLGRSTAQIERSTYADTHYDGFVGTKRVVRNEFQAGYRSLSLMFSRNHSDGDQRR